MITYIETYIYIYIYKQYIYIYIYIYIHTHRCIGLLRALRDVSQRTVALVPIALSYELLPEDESFYILFVDIVL